MVSNKPNNAIPEKKQTKTTATVKKIVANDRIESEIVKNTSTLKPLKTKEFDQEGQKPDQRPESNEESGKLHKTAGTTVKEKTQTEGTTTKVAASKPASSKKSDGVKNVKIPKTSATGKVPYEPDFTHSVLDAPQPEEVVPNLPTLRYSDNELIEFKTLIQRKLEAAKKELTYLQGLITRKDEMGGDNDDGRYMTMEDGSLSMEREQLSQMASRQITFVDHLEKAMMRIENKTYGICRVTGKLIDKARLRAVPHATLSMEAKSGKSRTY